jgi:curved DNA-binding protein CbpA
VENPFIILGLPPSATGEEITSAYRKLVRRYPPELAPQRFARIHSAYQLLTSPARRMETARSVPEETLALLFPVPEATFKPAPPPPSLGAEALEPLLAPCYRGLLVRLLRDIVDG